jgi:2-octaprenyl-6-methoxyphenol hydroxylase
MAQTLPWRMSMTHTAPTSRATDVLIAGGGHVGLTLALALRRAAPILSVTLVDASGASGASGSARHEGRASAIAAAGRRMLESLDVWRAMADDAQPINEMIVTDSRTRDAVRPIFLTFSGAAKDGEPFAHMVMNRTMIDALHAAALDAGVEVIAPDAVVDFTTSSAAISAELGEGEIISTRLLIAADGVKSRLREFAGIRTATWSYGQSGIVVTVAHERPHGGRAEEHFLPAGPFAILPLRGNRASLVWTERSENADRIIADPVVFQIELERRFGHRLGHIETVGKPNAFPLGLTLARSFVKPRLALAGDAAHGIHPIAGQGLNLGFRDVAALAETIVEAHRLGLDIGSLAVLERYERWRRFDSFEMGAVTDALNRLFSNDNPVLRLARDVGLGLVDRLPPLKKAFIQDAAGEGGALPRLLRGEAI